MITIIEDIPTLEIYREKWNELLTMVGDLTPFQTFDYVYSAWKTMPPQNGKLYILCYVRQKDNKLLAICPFYIDTNSTLRFINDIHTDFCDVIISKEVREHYHVWEDIFEYIKSDKNILRVELINIVSDSLLLSFGRYFMIPSVVYCTNAYSKISLSKPSTDQCFSDFLWNLTGNEKKKLRNLVSKSSKLGFRIYSKSEISYPEMLVRYFANIMTNEGIRTENYIYSLLHLIRDLYLCGLVSIFITYSESEPVAMKVFLKCDDSDEYISWLMLYSDKKMNQLNMVQSMNYISEKGGIYNFARGTYGYKMEKFRPAVYNLYTLRWSKSIWGQIGDLFAMNLYHMKQIVKKIIRK